MAAVQSMLDEFIEEAKTSLKSNKELYEVVCAKLGVVRSKEKALEAEQKDI